MKDLTKEYKERLNNAFHGLGTRYTKPIRTKFPFVTRHRIINLKRGLTMDLELLEMIESVKTKNL